MSFCQMPVDADEINGKYIKKQNMIYFPVRTCCDDDNNVVLCAKLYLSEVMNIQTLLSGYYAPLKISIFLNNMKVFLETISKVLGHVGSVYTIMKLCLCKDEIMCMSAYVAAFDDALVKRSSSNNVHMSFDTYPVFTNPVAGAVTEYNVFWLRQPVKYLRCVY